MHILCEISHLRPFPLFVEKLNYLPQLHTYIIIHSFIVSCMQDLNVELPSVVQLLEHETLRNSNSNVKFLIQTGYEHIQRQLMDEDVAMSG